MARRKSWMLFILSVVGLNACQMLKPLPKTAETAVSSVRMPCHWIPDRPLFSGRLVLSSPQRTFSGDFQCFIASADTFRFLLQGPFGIPVAVVEAAHRHFRYYDVLGQTIYETDSLAAISPLLKFVPQQARYFVELLSGCFDMQQWRTYQSPDTLYRILPTAVERLVVGPQGLPLEYQRRDRTTSTTFGIRYQEFAWTDTLVYPALLRCYLPRHEVQVELRISQFQLFTSPDSVAFAIPHGIRRIRF